MKPISRRDFLKLGILAAPALASCKESRMGVYDDVVEEIPEILPNPEITEDDSIRYTADRVGVDENYLFAIRKAENGGPGIEFGIMHTGAYDRDDGVYSNGKKVRDYNSEFEKQCSWAAWTVKKNNLIFLSIRMFYIFMLVP